jgi:ectoine hydroxylase-related dioxygenase (phytanoyl-CoA dioxygenase family)
MAYVPGSHLLGVKRFVDITHTLHPEPYAILEDPALAGLEPVWVEVPAGAVVFHHSLTVHLAAPNSTDRTRRVFCVIYFADGCVRRNPIPHVSVDRQGIGVGEPIRGDVTPLAWPNPTGALPPTPSSGRGPRTGFY